MPVTGDDPLSKVLAGLIVLLAGVLFWIVAEYRKVTR